MSLGNTKINVHAPAPVAGPGDGAARPERPAGLRRLLLRVVGHGRRGRASCWPTVGAEIEEGPVERRGGRGGGRDLGTSVYTRDPDGNLLEFITYP